MKEGTGAKTKESKVLNYEISFGRVNLTQRALLAKHLAVMLHSGLTITDALDTAASSASPALKRILERVSGAVISGKAFSAALAEHPKVFSGLFVNAIFAGESSGTLVENLENLATELERERSLASKIKSAMLYPMVILIAATILGFTLALFILPKILPLFKGLSVELPATTRGLISFTEFMQANGTIVAIIFPVVVIGVVVLARKEWMRPYTNWISLHVPVIKQISGNANRARFVRTLGMLLKSGVRINEALKILEDSLSNYYYQSAVRHLRKEIEEGKRLAEGMEAYPMLFPVIMTRMIRVGEESGKFEESLFYLAGFYEGEVETATKALATAIEPILLLIIGGIVAFLALSIITPIYEITGGVNR